MAEPISHDLPSFGYSVSARGEIGGPVKRAAPSFSEAYQRVLPHAFLHGPLTFQYGSNRNYLINRAFDMLSEDEQELHYSSDMMHGPQSEMPIGETWSKERLIRELLPEEWDRIEKAVQGTADIAKESADDIFSRSPVISGGFAGSMAAYLTEPVTAATMFMPAYRVGMAAKGEVWSRAFKAASFDTAVFSPVVASAAWSTIDQMRSAGLSEEHINEQALMRIGESAGLFGLRWSSGMIIDGVSQGVMKTGVVGKSAIKYFKGKKELSVGEKQALMDSGIKTAAKEDANIERAELEKIVKEAEAKGKEEYKDAGKKPEKPKEEPKKKPNTPGARESRSKREQYQGFKKAAIESIEKMSDKEIDKLITDVTGATSHIGHPRDEKISWIKQQYRDPWYDQTE